MSSAARLLKDHWEARNPDALDAVRESGLKVAVNGGLVGGFPWASVDLPPDLPLEVYSSQETWNPDRVHALALYCSDGRWGNAFDEFCHTCLRIPRYDRLAIPGGPAWLTREESNLTSPFFAVRGQLDFLVQVHELERIVLVTHFGCAFYTEMLHQPPADCLPMQLTDLRTSASLLRSWFPQMTIETYLAMRRGPRLSFHEVES